MYSDETKWMSQTIYSHRDREYGTNGYMRVSISTKTKDSLSFSPPNFVINIQNEGVNKNVALSYQQLFDVYNRMKEVVQAAGKEYAEKEASPDSQLHYKVAKSTYLTIEFLRGNQGEPIVRLSISHGSSNTSKVIMPFLPEFISFINLIGDMIGNKENGISSKYLDWCLHLPNRFFFIEMNEIAQQIPGLVKSAVVQIDREKSDDNSGDPEDEDEEIDPEAEAHINEQIQEFNNFLGDDMENIELDLPPNLQPKEEKKASPTKKKEDKIYNWLKGDFGKYEDILLDSFHSKNPIRAFEKELTKIYPSLDFFPGISEQEMKSVLYLSLREYNFLKNCSKDEAIPGGFIVSKYFGNQHAKPENVELAINLLTLNFYLRACREKLEAKIDDNRENKAYAHLASTVAMPFIFSFLSKDIEIKSIVMNRLKEWRELGLFDEYEKDYLHIYGLAIKESDILTYMKGIELYMDSPSYDKDSLSLHKIHESCKFKPDMPLNEEQIINELLPLELEIVKRGLTARDEIVKTANLIGVSEPVLSLFVKTKTNIGKKIPIIKFFEDNASEVPDEVRDEFMQVLIENNDRDYDLSDQKFTYAAFGENAIKALYLWKPESGEKYLTYKNFEKAVKNNNHDKSTILSMIENESETNEGSFGDFYGKVK